MPNFRVKTIGLRSITRRLQKFPMQTTKAIQRSLILEAEGIMTQSKELVPVDTGALRSSGHVQPPTVSLTGGVSIRFGYGGPAVGYAIYVHEDLQAFHEVGMAKYLEMPFRQALPGMSKRIMREIRQEVKK